MEEVAALFMFSPSPSSLALAPSEFCPKEHLNRLRNPITS